MREFGNRLRERAKVLALSDAEVARRAGLAPRRYGFYVTGDRQPDFQTLIAICDVLNTTPNYVLGVEDTENEDQSERAAISSRLDAALNVLSIPNLKLVVEHAELLLRHQRPK